MANMRLVIEIKDVPKEVADEFVRMVSKYVNEQFEIVKSIKIEYDGETPYKPPKLPPEWDYKRWVIDKKTDWRPKGEVFKLTKKLKQGRWQSVSAKNKSKV